ncbi:hypothetical protein [Aeoliella sp.]|uniref:hypothetical protein n=1 Tax=Aeoliella sp. TaxID=2795800 RepID=UPI003CCC3E1D
MARQKEAREDLLRDAVAFVERIMFTSPECAEVFVGFRTSGAASVYLDQDPVYHFNSSGQLRRGYVAGELLKADKGKLIAMHRERPGGEVQLVSRVLDPSAKAVLLQQARQQLQALLTSIEHNAQVIGQVPEERDLHTRATEWLREIVAAPLEVANSPHAR